MAKDKPVLTPEEQAAKEARIKTYTRGNFVPGDASKLTAWRENMRQNDPEAFKAFYADTIAKAQAGRRKHKSLRDIYRTVLPMTTDDQAMKQDLEAMELDPSYEMAMALALIRKAQEGDTEANRYIRDTIGEKPTENYNMGITGKPIEALDLSQLTDEELEALATDET